MNRSRKILVRCAAMCVLVGTAVATGGQPASAASYPTLRANLWAYTDSHDPKASFVKQDGNVPLGTRLDDNQQAHTSRFYFSIDITPLRGTALHRATLVDSERSVADCSASATIELWRTGAITDQTSWNKPPAELERLGSATTHENWQCPYGIGLDVLPAVQAALTRHDPKITFEMRLTAADEPETSMARTMANRPQLLIWNNIPPTVSDPTAGWPGACGGMNQPTPASRTVSLDAKVADADGSNYLTGQFALWPAAHPDQRTVVGGYGYGWGANAGIRNGSVDLSGFADSTLVAWAVRSYDQQDYSAWAKPCYLLVDRTAPRTAPTVVSPTFLESSVTQSGGQGVAGEFRFDANGDRDVVSFRYSDSYGKYGTVAANKPGGRATISYTPDIAGPRTLTVTPIDAAGNYGPPTGYDFYVGWTAPGVTVDLGGVGLPSRITMYSTVDGVTGFSYQIEDGKEVKFPASGGSGTAELTFTHTGYTPVTARTYADNKVLGVTTYYAMVSDAPQVSSDQFSWQRDAVLGDRGSFTFRPFTTGVVAYRYSFGGDWQRIDANPDGTAVLEWTAGPAGWTDLEVASIQADGSVSQQTSYQFYVIDPRPNVWVDLQSWPRRDGVGLPVEVEFSSWMPSVTGFAYTLNGGPEQIVSGGPYAWTTVTPDRPGDNTIVAESIYGDGNRSPSTTYTFQITDAPIVSWNGGTMMPGDTATFSIRPALPGVTSYQYTFDPNYSDRQSGTVAANADGTASLAYVLGSPGYHTVAVASVGSGGTVSDVRTFEFIVNDPAVGVYGYYNDWSPRGGIGVPGYMSFWSGMPSQVVEFVYQVNGGPEQAVALPPDSAGAWVTITPDRNGVNTLMVRSLMTDGRYSPTTTYNFLVGTAPLVQSMEYPDSNWGGGAGVTGTFVFSGGTAGITSFVYQIDYGARQEVAAGPQGVASMRWTPPNSGSFTLTVQGKLVDGTLTDQTTYQIYVL